MILSDKKRFIFIHVPKTGGTSITQALKPYATVGVHKQYAVNGTTLPKEVMKHARASVVKRYVASNKWDSYFKFGFVRNPWDLLVSMYHWQKTYRSADFKNFEDYIFRFKNAYAQKRTKLLIGGQRAYVMSGGTKIVNRVCRYENFNKELEFLEEKLGVPLDLKYINKTQHRHYRDYYTKSTTSIVSTIFKEDIAKFNYHF